MSLLTGEGSADLDGLRIPVGKNTASSCSDGNCSGVDVYDILESLFDNNSIVCLAPLVVFWSCSKRLWLLFKSAFVSSRCLAVSCSLFSAVFAASALAALSSCSVRICLRRPSARSLIFFAAS